MSEDTKQVKISLDPKNYRVKIDSEGKRRMKIYIKLTKEDSQGWMDFVKQVKPDDMSQDDFALSIFMRGVADLQRSIMETIEKVKAEEELTQDGESSEDSVEEEKSDDSGIVVM